MWVFVVLLCYHGNKLSSHFISDQISRNQPILGMYCRKMRNNNFFFFLVYRTESTHPKQNKFCVKHGGIAVLLCYHDNKLSDQISMNHLNLGLYQRNITNNKSFLACMSKHEHLKQNKFCIKLVGF